MKLVASEYLKCTLNEFIKAVLERNIDCEVDPTKLSNQSNLEKNRLNLMAFVRMAWASIQDKAHLFPEELRKSWNIPLDKQLDL
uniref:Ras-GAP domain-containing protein n=1 Tax=Panagrolaimus superbus TaxID=310955 RepID=A0A914YE55_9BILA